MQPVVIKQVIRIDSNNNPLKFTDPSGHGWFSKLWKKIKKWTGTIMTVAFSMVLGPMAGAIIGSAIGTLANGGTFKSFAIGVAVGFAASCIASALGGAVGWSDIASKGLMTYAAPFVAGAVTGAIAGGISSAIYGRNIGRGMAEGALGGAIGAGAAIAAGAGTIVTTGKSIPGMMTLQEFLVSVAFGDVPQKYTGNFWKDMWDACWNNRGEIGMEAVKGGAAWADGVIPKWDPFESTYANSDGSIDGIYEFSRIMGNVSRDASIAAFSSPANIGTYLSHPIKYEAGCTALSNYTFLKNGLYGLDQVRKGEILLKNYGSFRNVYKLTNMSKSFQLWNTGLTPGGGLMTIGFCHGVDATSK